MAEIKDIPGGQYVHYGLQNGIVSKLSSVSVNTTSLTLQVNIDGLPVFKSSNTQVWPILAVIRELPTRDPFVVGIFCGASKPADVSEYLSDFVQEVKRLETEGAEIGGTKFSVTIQSFICDAPARSFLKCTKSHNGYYGCDRCCQKGLYQEHCMTYPEIDSAPRTDVQFNEMKDENHHMCPSPLAELNIGLVSGFVLDYMHLVCLGATRRLLNLWLRGSLKFRISATKAAVLSQVMLSLNAYLPVEFPRKLRALREIDRWKATEFRMFLLYIGPVVLKDSVNAVVYHNFLCLSVAIYLLASPNLSAQYCDYMLSVF